MFDNPLSLTASAFFGRIHSFWLQYKSCEGNTESKQLKDTIVSPARLSYLCTINCISTAETRATRGYCYHYRAGFTRKTELHPERKSSMDKPAAFRKNSTFKCEQS